VDLSISLLKNQMKTCRTKK